MAIPTYKEADNMKNSLLKDYANNKINIKELVNLAFDAGYAHCYYTYLATSENH